jgi:hypothetical protein
MGGSIRDAGDTLLARSDASRLAGVVDGRRIERMELLSHGLGDYRAVQRIRPSIRRSTQLEVTFVQIRAA